MQTSLPTQRFSESKEITQDDLKTIIRELGLKVTQQRLLILDTILRGRVHVTAQSVFDQVARLSPDIGFATVYRFLRSLSEHGFLTEVRIGGQPARYEWAQKNHHDHLTCTVCHRICEFENPEIEDLQQKIAAEMGFRLTDHLLELFGVCSDCQKRQILS